MMIPFFSGLLTGLILAGFAALLMRRRSTPRATPGAPQQSSSPTADTFRSLLGEAPTHDAATSRQERGENEAQVIERLRQNLRVKFLYQEDQVDHAIELERERTPGATLEQLMRAAIDRYERENR